MSAVENVFGVGVKLDAQGKPIERGIGNLADRAARAAAAVAAAPPPVAPVATVAAPTVGAAAPADSKFTKFLHTIEDALKAGEAKTEAEIAKLVAEL